MLEMINKMNNLSHAISDVLPKKRIKKLAKTILVKPVTKAMEKQEMSFDEEDFKENVYKVIDKFSPETLNAILMMSFMKNANNPRTVESWMKILDSDDIQSAIEKFVSSLENNAEDIGKIVKKICMVSLKIMSELTNNDESEDSDEDSDEESDVHIDKDSLLLIMKIMGTTPVASKVDDSDDKKEDSDEEGNKNPSEKVEPQANPETHTEESYDTDCIEETESASTTEHVEETSVEPEHTPTTEHIEETSIEPEHTPTEEAEPAPESDDSSIIEPAVVESDTQK